MPTFTSVLCLCMCVCVLCEPRVSLPVVAFQFNLNTLVFAGMVFGCAALALVAVPAAVM